MPGTYEHVIRLEVDKNIGKVPNVFGIGEIINQEVTRIVAQIDSKGKQLLTKLGSTSQTIQQQTALGMSIYQTGRLVSSIKPTQSGNEIHIGTSIYYASYVHDGHGATVHLTDWGGHTHNYGSAEPRPWVDISWEIFEPTIDPAVDGMLSSISL